MIAALIFALAVNLFIGIFIALDARKYRAGMTRKRIRADMALLAKRNRGITRWKYS